MNFGVVENTERVRLTDQSWTPLCSCGIRETLMAEMLGKNTQVQRAGPRLYPSPWEGEPG